MTKTNKKTPASKRKAPASKRAAAVKAKKSGSITRAANGTFAAPKSAKKSNQAAKLLQDKRVVAVQPLRASNERTATNKAKKSNRAVQKNKDNNSSTMDHDAYRTTELEPSDVVFSKWAILFKKHPGTNDYLDMVHDSCFTLGKIQDRTKEKIDEMIAKIWDFVVDEKQGRFLTYHKPKGFGLLTPKEARNKIKRSLYRYRKYYFIGSPEAYKTGPRIRGDVSGNDNASGDDESNNSDASTDPKVIRFAPRKNDIIYGTSNKATMEHPGNVFYQSLLQKYFPKLEKANDPTKEQYRAMTNEIVQVVVHQRKGRFLRPTDHKGRFERKSDPNYCLVLAPTVVEYKVRCALYKHRSWFRKNMLPDSNDNDDDDGSLPPPKTTRKQRRGHSLNPHKNMVGPDDSDSEHSFMWSEDSDDEDNEEEGDEEEGDEEEGDEDDDDDKEECDEEEGNEDDNNQLQYGSQHSEMEMRRWLKQHRLPQSVGDTLVMHRVRDLNHVRLAVEVESDYLAEKLRASDFAKLCRAVESMDGNGA